MSAMGARHHPEQGSLVNSTGGGTTADNTNPPTPSANKTSLDLNHWSINKHI
jgi:hypothetical protein